MTDTLPPEPGLPGSDPVVEVIEDEPEETPDDGEGTEGASEDEAPAEEPT